MSFPREEQMDMSHLKYVENAEWRLFLDLEGELHGMQVLMILEDRYTVLDGATFRAMAERILAKL